MTDDQAQILRHQNDYLRARCSQLQAEVADLSTEVERLQHLREAVLQPISREVNAVADGQ